MNLFYSGADLHSRLEIKEVVWALYSYFTKDGVIYILIIDKVDAVWYEYEIYNLNIIKCGHCDA